MSQAIEARLAELGVTLPNPAAPLANYVPSVVTGNLLFVSGQLPMGPDGLAFKGTLGAGASVEDGQAAAKLCAINILAQARAALGGDIERIVRIVKLVGFVASTADFGDQPKVINGCSDFMVAALGDRGKHARSAVGVAALPFGASVEVEAIIEIR